MSVESYTLHVEPKWVGRWQIGGKHGLTFYVTKRPRWLTRFLLRYLLEWEWEDRGR